MKRLTVPEGFKLVDASGGPVTTDGGVTCDYVSLKNVKKAWIIAMFTQAVAHTTGIDPVQATAVAGTGAKALSENVPIWSNQDTATSDTLERETDAKTLNLDEDIKKKMVVFQIDPATFDQANGFDVLGCTVDDSSQATNFVSILYVLDMRYKSDTPPSVITD